MYGLCFAVGVWVTYFRSTKCRGTTRLQWLHLPHRILHRLKTLMLPVPNIMVQLKVNCPQCFLVCTWITDSTPLSWFASRCDYQFCFKWFRHYINVLVYYVGYETTYLEGGTTNSALAHHLLQPSRPLLEGRTYVPNSNVLIQGAIPMVGPTLKRDIEIQLATLERDRRQLEHQLQDSIGTRRLSEDRVIK